MQHRTNIALAKFAFGVLFHSMGLTLFVVGVVYGAMLNEAAARLIHSKFVMYVIDVLEYAIVVGDATYIMHAMRSRFWKSVWFVLRVAFRYSLYLPVAPLVGAFREVTRTHSRIDAEIRAFVEAHYQ
jgi:hypothetical protein